MRVYSSAILILFTIYTYELISLISLKNASNYADTDYFKGSD